MNKIKLLILMSLLIGNRSFSAESVKEKSDKISIPKAGKTSTISTDIEETENSEIEEKEKIKTKILFKKKIKDSEIQWKLVWNDEFDGDDLDKTKWDYWENDNPWKNGNYVDENGVLIDQYGFNVKHYYLKDNVKVKNGKLIIELKKEDNKTVKIDKKERKILYSSGAIHTKDIYNVKTGKIEMRAAMPKGIGVWPAFWMWPEGYSQSFPKPAQGEIDIFEIYGEDLRKVTGTLHALKSDNTYESFIGKDLKISRKKPDLTEFNVYALEWDEKEIKWLFNGKVFKKVSMKKVSRKTENPFNQPYYLMINVALQNKTGEDEDVHFPTEMKVDYVRVYQK
ncbi:family 16 glycosylhydrolase [Leptotrichia sp. OH3620_COT-345]|uniref:glycoside hydrolase family 16 protein n=1 Tax=Leptotrichia sp. OH3620_COT-345 TaxID=2491048 RepID=UPI001F4045BA|nr:glycoside hydrolase family 16 protein [Leptotrichia sp. OH3620_COT-345]